jgi:lipoprotein-anchoring transpeptidase ErfK/SrfK
MVRPLVTTVVVLLVAALGVMAVAATRRAKANRSVASQPAAAAPAAPAAAATPRATKPAARSAAPARPKSFPILRVRPGHSVALRSKPRGRVLASIGATTQFGSPTTLAVAAQHGGWLGVTSTQLANGKIGWIKANSGSYGRHGTRLSIRIDLSQRRLRLMSGDRVLRRATVGIGRPGSPTPTGRYAVTDKLAGSRYGAFYGCCILALSGHQTNTPAGWRGGDRLAIHGTNDPGSIGVPSSAGCLHADTEDLRVLMRRVPLGTPVLISA